MTLFARMLAICTVPLMLTACLFQPGKFTSSLDINADRSFVFSYLGEIRAAEMDELTKGLPKAETADGSKDAAEDAAEEKPGGMSEAEKAALADTLSKEAGFRKVEYRGDDIWFVDYRIAGTLSHSFVFPYNLDAEMIFPFVVIEPRANGTVRMKAPAFASSAMQPDVPGMGGNMGGGNDRIEGDFTVTTNAEIISQTNEDGAVTGPDGRKTIRWRITPQTSTAPMAVFRMKN